MATRPNLDSTLIWRKSSVSADAGNCVEVVKRGSSVLVRDSRDRAGAILGFGQAPWREFVARIKNRNAGRG